MKTSRKLLPLLLLICILFGCVSANADTELTAENGTNTAQSTVVLDLGVQPTTYTIVIPSQITIDPATGTGTGIITLKSGFVLTDITSLKVRLTDGYSESSSSDNGYMRLNNTVNDSYLDCTVSGVRNANGVQMSCVMKKTTDLIAVTNQSSNDKDKIAKVILTVDNIPSYGKYTGTLTFSVITE